MNPSPIDPSVSNFAAQVEARIISYDEEYAVETYPAEHRKHLGASSIGEECYRKLWLTFRWAKLQQAEGRMRRLWNRGSREEPQFEQFLLWAGIKLQSINPKTNKQYLFSKLNGHYGGATDGVGLISWAKDYPVIVEYKTFADKYFQKLKKERLKLSNPKYFAQMCSYGREFEVKHALFGAVNKDTDERYWEFVELDYNYSIELERKAGDIINAVIPPAKISEQAAFWKCKSCHFHGICFYNEKPEVNCRSCKFSSPGLDANWVCNKFGVIPKAAIKDGCPQWEGVI